MAAKKQTSQSNSTPSPVGGQFRAAYTKPFAPALANRVGKKGKEHAQIILNVSELATVGIGALLTAEVNHTRPANHVWGWRIGEMVASLPVLAYTQQNTALGRLALGVFLGAAVESLIDSTGGLTGWAALPPTDSVIRMRPTDHKRRGNPNHGA